MAEGTQSDQRVIVSICGAAGSGKSRLAKALVAELGDEVSVRVPTYYYLMPATDASGSYSTIPLRYDWALLEHAVALPEGAATATQNFDFETFQRVANVEGKPFAIRRLVFIDAMYPYPKADVTILLAPPRTMSGGSG